MEPKQTILFIHNAAPLLLVGVGVIGSELLAATGYEGVDRGVMWTAMLVLAASVAWNFPGNLRYLYNRFIK